MIRATCVIAVTAIKSLPKKKARREAGLTGVRRISAKDRFTMRQNEI
jgi:hypothetical protein